MKAHKLSIKQKEVCYFGLSSRAEWSAECCDCFRLIFGRQRAPDETRPRAICLPPNPHQSPHSTHKHTSRQTQTGPKLNQHMDMGGSVNMLKLGDNILILHDHPLTRRQADQMLHPAMDGAFEKVWERKGIYIYPHALQCNCWAFIYTLYFTFILYIPFSTNTENITYYSLLYWSNSVLDPGVSAWQTEGY